jgi:acyl-coenzyme A synthetase/AMP-(fatty) acid ligase
LPSEPSDARSAIQASVSYFSTGTTGVPKQIAFTEEDWQQSVEHRASFLEAMGVRAGQRVGVLVSFGPWFSGDHITDALLTLGASVLPAGISVAHMPAVARLFEQVGVTAVVTTPSVALSLASLRRRLDLKQLILVGEHLSPQVRNMLHTVLGVEPLSLFASSEAIIGFEAPGRQSVFRWDPERTFLEVRDCAGRLAPAGVGELVVTARVGAAMPLLRYPLGDLVELDSTASTGYHGFRFLGRVGQGIGLATGVRLGGQEINSWLDSLGAPISLAELKVEHMTDGRDRVSILLAAPGSPIDETHAAATFRSISPEIADAVDCGYVDVNVRCALGSVASKRRLKVAELPWRL